MERIRNPLFPLTFHATHLSAIYHFTKHGHWGQAPRKATLDIHRLKTHAKAWCGFRSKMVLFTMICSHIKPMIVFVETYTT